MPWEQIEVQLGHRVIDSVTDLYAVFDPDYQRETTAALEKKFFNYAAPQAEVIAFILPRSFRKASVQNKLDRNFHLVHEEDVERNAFIVRGRPFHMPAVFQIWVRRGVERALIPEQVTHPDFELSKDSDGADFVIQRVGARAGRIHRNFEKSWKAHCLVRANHPRVEAIMRQLDFSRVTRDVAGKPSLAKSEIVSLYREFTEVRARKRKRRSKLN